MTKSTSGQPCFAIPIWYFVSYWYRLCLSFSICTGPLACAIWGLIESCEAQVGFGCRLLPTGIRRWRASAKTTANIDPESLCTQRCLNQTEANTQWHTWKHTFTVTCKNDEEVISKQYVWQKLIKTNTYIHSAFLWVTMWNYPILTTVFRVVSILAVWPWLFVRKLRDIRMYYHLFKSLVEHQILLVSWSKFVLQGCCKSLADVASAGQNCTAEQNKWEQ